MRILIVAHGYPPELVGGTENAAAALARALAARGHEVGVFAGTLELRSPPELSRADDVDPLTGARFPVWRAHRGDLYFDHWQKSNSAHVRALFREVLADFLPDVVHVHHWIRLTRDLVATAARAGVPAVATLHDLWSTCLIAFRVRPDTKEFCEAPLAPDPCIDCANHIPPRTPWVPREQLVMELYQRRADLVRELSLARAVLAPSVAHARTVDLFLGRNPEDMPLVVVPPGRELPLRRPEPLAAPGEMQPLVLAAWGHLAPLKGYDLLLEALEILGAGDRVQLEIAGGEVDAEHAASLHARADRRPGGSEVRFHGPFDAAKLDREPVSQAHLMVSGTRAHESWGMVVDEALTLGLPCVLPRSGAFVERAAEAAARHAPGWALLYERGDAHSLAAALRRVLDEPELLGALRGALPPAELAAPSLMAHVDATLKAYHVALERGAPVLPAVPWFQERMEAAAERDWDRRLAQSSGEALGLVPESKGGA
ncbi:MAG: glycosyltransferase [Planctomycetaceae bacterium]|nr:glycosyltransferase [Planctomycetaceae bacterium]